MIEKNIEVISKMINENEAMKLSNEMLRKIHWNVSRQTKQHEIIVNATMFPIYEDIQEHIIRKQYDFIETLEVIKSNKLSFARYGDAEFQFMFIYEFKNAVEKSCFYFAKKLKEVLKKPVNNLLIGMPYPFRGLYYSGVYSSIWSDLKSVLLVGQHQHFGLSHVTRPIFFQWLGSKGVELFRSIWEGLNVTIVTGKGSRFDLIPELFDNINDSKFVYGSPIHAFDGLDNLIGDLEDDTSDLILLSLGGAGTILAYELTKRGKWVLDIGNISSSYEFVFKNGLLPEKKAAINNNK